MNAQDKLPFYEIGNISEKETVGTVAARMIEGLGFRYYWATKKLKAKDLAYKPSKDARSIEETIDHILDLSQVIVNATLKKTNGAKQPEMTFEEKRAKTLNNLKTASDILKQSNDLSQYKIIFGKREFSFFNAINGPIADAIWHCGQIVSFRRSAGNPLPKGVQFLTGTVKQ